MLNSEKLGESQYYSDVLEDVFCLEKRCLSKAKRFRYKNNNMELDDCVRTLIETFRDGDENTLELLQEHTNYDHERLTRTAFQKFLS